MQLDIQKITSVEEIEYIGAKALSSNNLAAAEQVADRFFQLKHFLQAINIYKEIIERDPEFDYQIAGVGNLEEQVGYYEWDSYEWYKEQRAKKLIKGSPYDALSLCCLANSKYQAGIEWYKQMTEKYPKNYQLIFGYANILSNNSIYEEAINNYQVTTKLKPHFIKAHIDLSLLYEYRRIQKRKSTQKAKQVLHLDTNNQYALFVLARNENDIDKKIQLLTIAWEINVGYTRICNEVGICYGGVKKQYQEAIKWYQKCTEINPKYSSCYNNIGVNNELLKRYEQAQKWYFRAAEADKQYKTAYKNLSDVFDQLKFSDQEIIKQSKNYKVQEDMLCYYLGLSYYDKDKIQKSIKWIERAITINSNEHRFYNSLAISYDEEKEYEKAIQNYKKCIEIMPSYYSAYYNLAIVYKAQNNQDEAIKWYIKATQINPRYSYAYNNLGNIYKKRESFQEAIYYYRKAIEFNSTYTLAYINLGVCHLNIKQYKEASVAFESAQEIVNTDNNNLSQSNKQFIRPHLEKFQVEGNKWRKFGSVSRLQKQNLTQITRQFQDSLGEEKAQLSIDLSILSSKELTDTMRLLGQHKFQLSCFRDVLQNIQGLYLLNKDLFSIIPESLFQFFWKKKFSDQLFYSDIEVQIQNILSKEIQIQQQHFPISKQLLQNEKFIFQSLKKYQQLEGVSGKYNLFQEIAYFTHADKLLSEIINVHNSIKKELPTFQNFINAIKESINIGTKSNISLRIPSQNQHQFAAILGIFEQIFRGELGDGIKFQITDLINQNLNDLVVRTPKAATYQLYKTWLSQLTTIFLEERIKNNEETNCYVTDFAVGTCLFRSVQEIVEAVTFVHQKAKDFGFEVLVAQNNLLMKGQSSFNLILKRKEAIFTLRLELESMGQKANFFRELRKIEHSPFGCIFECLLAKSRGRKHGLYGICQDLLEKLKIAQFQGKDRLFQLATTLCNVLPTKV